MPVDPKPPKPPSGSSDKAIIAYINEVIDSDYTKSAKLKAIEKAVR